MQEACDLLDRRVGLLAFGREAMGARLIVGQGRPRVSGDLAGSCNFGIGWNVRAGCCVLPGGGTSAGALAAPVDAIESGRLFMLISSKIARCSPAAVVGFGLTVGVGAATLASRDLGVWGGREPVMRPSVVIGSPDVGPTAFREPR